MSPPAATRSLTAVTVCQAGLNILVLLLFALLVVSAYHDFAATRSIKSLGILAINSLFLGLFMTRRPATAEADSLPVWVLAVAGTACPLLLRPSDAPTLLADIGSVIQIAGIVLIVSGLLSLRRSFSVAPGNRGIRQGGLYRIVRHPIYFSELLAFMGVVVANPTLTNSVLWLCECALQYARARAEENFLLNDPVYRSYFERVRYRLIPGLL